MRVLVTGGRDFEQAWFVDKILDKFHVRRPITLLIEGGASGADTLARKWAIARGVEFKTVEADWETYGNHAGRVRNVRMLREQRPQLVVMFAGGKGTRHMVRIAQEAGVPVFNTVPHMVKVRLRSSRAT